jgi:hypothetical protein
MGDKTVHTRRGLIGIAHTHLAEVVARDSFGPVTHGLCRIGPVKRARLLEFCLT